MRPINVRQGKTVKFRTETGKNWCEFYYENHGQIFEDYKTYYVITSLQNLDAPRVYPKDKYKLIVVA